LAVLLSALFKVQTLSQQLQEYQGAYQAAEEDKQGLTQQLTEVGEELERSENVRKRLNEDVTELQVQLDLERQRSKSCTIL
jgi:predicted  nucleic acid-binding Zn-ribbon protein